MNWKELLHNTEVILSIRLLYAAFLAILIGTQRTRVKKDPAILRTHVLICVGASLISTVGQWLSTNQLGFDPTRMAAQVVSGIGFVGMALIFKNDENVSGLTTASSLWLIGCIGIAVGFGAYILSTVAALIVLALLIISKDKNSDN